MKQNKLKKGLKEVLDITIYLFIVLVATYLVVRFVGQRTEVDGESMETTLQHGDQLLVDKISYRFKEPERFDIIVFPYAGAEDTLYIKRIIGLPGETVQIAADGTIYITKDGKTEALKENYGREIIRWDTRGVAEEPVVLGEDEYFVMGDNRNYSKDSRNATVGNIKREDIIGKAWVRIWPLSGFGTVNE